MLLPEQLSCAKCSCARPGPPSASQERHLKKPGEEQLPPLPVEVHDVQAATEAEFPPAAWCSGRPVPLVATGNVTVGFVFFSPV